VVEFIPRPTTVLEEGLRNLAAGLGGGLASSLSNIPTLLQQRREMQAENEFAKQMGIDLGQITNPQQRKIAISAGMKDLAEKQDYENIRNTFGKQFADVWAASPTGAKTALEKLAVDQLIRQQPIESLFGKEALPEEETIEAEERMIPQPILPGKEKKTKTASGEEYEFPEISFPGDFSGKEKVAYHNTLRKENVPIYTENITKNHALKDIDAHLKVMEDLNPEIPELAAKLVVDKEGNIRPTALRLGAVPESIQRFAKTVNDFLSDARNFFGARVTNFDIVQFKSRLPGLLNSKKGRAEIIEQMQILNKLERNYRDSLTKVYRHYGNGNITPEQADEIAEQMTIKEEERLRERLLHIGEETELPGGMILMRDPEGKALHVPPEDVEKLLELGATVAG
jgi:hypothetical protein